MANDLVTGLLVAAVPHVLEDLPLERRRLGAYADMKPGDELELPKQRLVMPNAAFRQFDNPSPIESGLRAVFRPGDPQLTPGWGLALSMKGAANPLNEDGFIYKNHAATLIKIELVSVRPFDIWTNEDFRDRGFPRKDTMLQVAQRVDPKFTETSDFALILFFTGYTLEDYVKGGVL